MGSKDGRPNGGGQVAIAMQTAHTKSNGDGISQDVAYTLEQTNSQAVLPPRVCPTLTAGGVGTDRAGASEDIDFMQVQGSSVRRLMPIECERLQGFPDGYTRIPYKKKTAAQCPDGPRYKALGNSMAVPVMHWIGRRIQMLEDLMKRNRIETIT
jgi:DNA (cytosine-5)-methyltransferase 1